MSYDSRKIGKEGRSLVLVPFYIALVLVLCLVVLKLAHII